MNKFLSSRRLSVLFYLFFFIILITGCSVVMPSPGPSASPMGGSPPVTPSAAMSPSPAPAPHPSAENVVRALFDAWANKDGEAMDAMFATARNIEYDFDKLKSIRLLRVELQTVEGESPAVFLTDFSIESTDGGAVGGFSDGVYSDCQFILERQDEHSPWLIVNWGY